MAISDYLLSSSVSGTRKKIIYVDDVQYSRFTLKRKLGEYYEIYTVESTAKMFEVADKIDPDMIILDINMPEVDGFEAIVKLKNHDRLKNIPVIFISSRDDKGSIVKGLDLGAVDYFIKPFDTEKLIESIEKQFNPGGKNKVKIDEIKQENMANILIVDDITSMLRTIHYSLHNKYNVTLLSKSELVVEYLYQNDTDLILLDLLMPVLNGFDLIPMIRALPKYAIVPIIIITTEGKPEIIEKARSLGVNDFIVKPFTQNELNDKVEKYINMYK